MRMTDWQRAFQGESLSDTRKLHMLNVIEKHHGPLESITSQRKARQDWLAHITECAENGQVALIVWSRDCDMCEGTYRYIVSANARDVSALCDSILDSAEGPTRFHLQNPSAPFKATFRDRALEAFENGRGTSVIL